MIVQVTGFDDEIIRDATKPGGQPGRMMDVSRAEKKFGGRAKVEFEEGVEEFGVWGALRICATERYCILKPKYNCMTLSLKT